METQSRGRTLALRRVGWLTLPLCYAVMLSVVMTMAPRPPADR
jgi:hypothetical protein